MEISNLWNVFRPSPARPALAPRVQGPADGFARAETHDAPTRPFQLANLFHKNPLDKVETELAQVKATDVQNLQTPEQFQAKTAELSARAKGGESLESLRPEAYAVAAQAAKMALGKTPFDSQLKGALAMDHGRVSQMGTGEGKTLTALMPLYLNALAGRGSHLVTVNDFLAQSGYEQNKPALDLLGVHAGIVLKDMTNEQKRAGYNADITYISNDTLGFDYLTDRMTRDPGERVQREPFAALVDEIDQVALDEARVPLIISNPQPPEELERCKGQYSFFKQVVDQLEPGSDYRVDLKDRVAFLTEHGEDMVANEVALLEAREPRQVQAGIRLRGVLREIEKNPEESRPTGDVPDEIRIMIEGRNSARDLLLSERDSLQAILPPANLYQEESGERVHFLNNALNARALYNKGRDYTVEDGQVQIVDEFKGRISEGRRFSNGLHQALEAKEGVEINPEAQTVASITYPNLLRRYERLAGMTGTAQSSANEFRNLLGLDVVPIPPNLKPQRVDHPDVIFATQQAKLEALAGEVARHFQEGVPVLVATRSVAVNKYVSEMLEGMGIPNQALNAEDVKTNTPEENQMIANAGMSGAVTVATNMAGRGVDIKPDKVNYKKMFYAVHAAVGEGKPVVVDLATPEEADRLKFWLNLPEAEADRLPTKILGAHETATEQTGTVQIRIAPSEPSPLGSLKSSDFPGNKLVVLATERNFDQRIDDQLKGRAGRQGAPGETQFFLSLEDDLLRIFGKEELDKIAAKIPTGQGLEGDKAVTKFVSHAQASVQTSNADARYQAARYDQIANQHREIVWSFRDALVDARPDVGGRQLDAMNPGETARDWTAQAWTQELDKELDGRSRPKDARWSAALKAVSEKLGVSLPIEKPGHGHSLQDRVKQAVDARFQELSGKFPQAFVEKYEWQVLLDSLDGVWTEHLEDLEDLKTSANLQTYAGKESFQAYKEMSTKAFDSMWKQAHVELAKKLLPVLEKESPIEPAPAWEIAR